METSFYDAAVLKDFKASRYETFNGVTNPYCFEIEGRFVNGTSGQPIDDIARYSDVTEGLNTLEKTLQWGHLAPTAPDTLNCYPYYDDDPFILDTQPDIYFAGNQAKFETKITELTSGDGTVMKTRLVCIPSFAKTNTCVVVNLSNLDCYPVSFDVADENNLVADK